MIINFSQEFSIFIHVLCQWLGITLGFRLYKSSITKAINVNDNIKEHSFMLFLMALSGAGIGLKIASFIEDPTPYINIKLTYQSILGVLNNGGSIVGAIIGAYLFIEIYKNSKKIKKSTGDYLVYGLILGIIIGRIGCFLAGKYDGTYGNETSSIFGVYFGNETIKRHPTQIYEMIFLTILLVLLKYFKFKLLKTDGLTFKLFAANYFLWRFIIYGLKPITYSYKIIDLSFSGIQLISIVASVYFYILIVFAYKYKYKNRL